VRDALEPLGPSEDLANAYIRLAGIQLFAYELKKSVELAIKARDTAIAAGAEDARIWSDVFIGSGLAPLPGHEEEGYAYLDRARIAGIERNAPWVAGNAMFNELETRVFNYRPRQALERGPVYLELSTRFGPGPQPGYIEGAARVFMGEPEAEGSCSRA